MTYNLFRFQRCRIVAITDAVRPYLQHQNGRGSRVEPTTIGVCYTAILCDRMYADIVGDLV